MTAAEILGAFTTAADASGLAKGEIAARADVSKRSVFYAYNHEVNPRIDDMVRMLEAVGLELYIRTLAVEDKDIEHPVQRTVPQSEWSKR